jgi:hypothetical protein
VSDPDDAAVIDHPDPRLSAWLRAAIIGTLVASLLGATVPGTAGRWLGGVAIAVIVGAPLLRVGYLAIRWGRIGDRRFAWVAFALLAVIAVGAAAASVL